MAYTNQAPVSVRVMAVDQAFAERQAILDQIGDEQRFRQRGENFQLDAEELVLYDDLKTLDFLLAERYKQRSEQVPAKSKRQQKKDAQLLRRLQSAISDIEIAQTDLILAMQKRDETILELLERGINYPTIASRTAMSNVSMAMIDRAKHHQGQK